jgi:predicted small lipoprotein YifL
MTSAASLKSVRLIHRYIGLFFSPTILFFAITGGLQMFGLHESARGSSYVPPNILVHLSQLHKKGTLYLPPRKVAPPDSAKSDGAKPDGPKLETPKPTQASLATPAPNSLAMKIFFAATALALAISTCTGLIMGWKYARRKSIVLLTLAAGVLIPVILVFV